MQCVRIENPGPNSHLTIVNAAKPNLQADELLVKVSFTAVNRADLVQRMGKYPPPPGAPNIPGLEIVGIIVDKGQDVQHFSIGERIYGLVSGGGYAEYCAVNHLLAHKIPDSWTDAFAVAVPEALTTVHATAYYLGRLKADETFLIHGAGSGIASLGIQMAKYTGANVITTVGQEEKISKAKALGADVILHYPTQDLSDAVGEHQVDVIVDFIGQSYFDKHLRLLKEKGKLIQIACMRGSQTTFSLANVIRKRLSIFGFMLRTQSIEEKSQLWRLAHEQWFNVLEAGKIAPVIDQEFTLKDIEKAHTRMQSSQHFGKIVIKVS